VCCNFIKCKLTLSQPVVSYYISIQFFFNDKKIKHALIKVGLTPNRIFGLCDIWVIILRRNVMYLYSKNSPNDIISGSFDGEKVDEEGIFYYRDNISSNE
jgi:hypothetical protein